MIHSKDFDSALNSLRAEDRAIDDAAAAEAVARFNNAYRGDAQKFKELRDNVLAQMCAQGHFCIEDLRSYELLIGRCFNPRAVEALRRHPAKRKGPWIPQVIEADVAHVLLQVNPDVKIDFAPREACRNKPRLDWYDISHHVQASSGSSSVPKSLFRSAKTIALAALNKSRVPVPHKV